MGEFSMTCSVSGLGISGGTPVRCLLLTASPYGDDDPRNAWIARTPPIRAKYNSYGSIEEIHKDDKFIADLWLRGLREDIVERGLGDNSCHDVPTSKDMSFDALLDAIQEGRVLVRQDVKNFWRRPLKSMQDMKATHIDEQKIPTLQTVQSALRADATLCALYPEPVSAGAIKDKFVVDEPVPHLVRVRFGQYQHGVDLTTGLNAAREAIVRAGYVGVVAAGSGRYADDADLLVFPAPNPEKHVRGPQWDMATGAGADEDKKLKVSMAMVREDVWQALIRYPHSDSVALDCDNCGQESWYHAEGRKCPSKMANKKPLKKHAKGAVYTHGPVFPEGVEHVVVPGNYGERVWYDLAAYRAGAREVWESILEHYSDLDDATAKKKKRKKADAADAADGIVDGWMAKLMEGQKVEAARIAALPKEEQEQIKAKREAQLEEWRAMEREKKENPHFGDFEITDFNVKRGRPRPGSWIFHSSVPGVIGVSAHLSMCLADKRAVPAHTIDAIAEMSAVNHVMSDVGIAWRPSKSTGPQFPEWNQHERFAKTLAKIAEAENTRDQTDMDEENPVFATLSEVEKRFGKK